MAERKSLKGYYLTTFLIGLGFFTMGLMDPLYDTYIPIFLAKYIDSSSLIGMIMTFDNILAIFLIPITSALSDRLDTPIGRRMPFIVILLPIAALLFGLIPFAALSSLWLLVALVFLFNLSKQSVRGPVVALMPDMVPGDLRSEANGVINTMGGIATILGTVALARLMDVYISLPGHEEPVNDILAFPVASLFVVLAVVLRVHAAQVDLDRLVAVGADEAVLGIEHVLVKVYGLATGRAHDFHKAVVFLILVAIQLAVDGVELFIDLVDAIRKIVIRLALFFELFGDSAKRIDDAAQQLPLLIVFNANAVCQAVQIRDLLGDIAHPIPPICCVSKPRQTRSMYSPVRVSTRMRSPSLTNKGTLIL